MNFNVGYTLWSNGGGGRNCSAVNNLLNRDPPNNIPSSLDHQQRALM
jgi:hypothetical protein